jgi:hypothetical protein
LTRTTSASVTLHAFLAFTGKEKHQKAEQNRCRVCQSDIIVFKSVFLFKNILKNIFFYF